VRATRRLLLLGLGGGSLAATGLFAPQAAVGAEKIPHSADPSRRGVSGRWRGRHRGADRCGLVIERCRTAGHCREPRRFWRQYRGGGGDQFAAGRLRPSVRCGQQRHQRHLYKKLPFDFIRDTAPVAGITLLTNIMLVPPSLPVKTVADFIALAKATPGELSFAPSGNGTSPHLLENCSS